MLSLPTPLAKTFPRTTREKTHEDAEITTPLSAGLRPTPQNVRKTGLGGGRRLRGGGGGDRPRADERDVERRRQQSEIARDHRPARGPALSADREASAVLDVHDLPHH